MGLLLTALIIGALITFTVIRLSISFTIWVSQYPNDIEYVFKLYFPYYIICLFCLCITVIIKFDAIPFVNYYFATVFFTALLIWRSMLISYRKKSTSFAVEPNLTHLP